MATFLDAVNRVLRINTVINNDDGDITTFSDTQHAADITRAKIAIQDELSEIISERLIPYEKATTTITLLTSTRTYTLASDFIRFYGKASFYDATDNIRIYEYPGGEEKLQHDDYQYKTTEGAPIDWYWDDTTSKSVGFYSVPNSTYNNRSLTYDYEKSVMVTDTTDTIPFHNNEEFYSFAQMAARRFMFMESGSDLSSLLEDRVYLNAKARLYQFLRPANPSNAYGYRYG